MISRVKKRNLRSNGWCFICIISDVVCYYDVSIMYVSISTMFVGVGTCI